MTGFLYCATSCLAHCASTSKTMTVNLQAGGRTVAMQADPDDEQSLISMMEQLKRSS